MKLLVALAPTVLLVIFGQLITKWRLQELAQALPEAPSKLSRIWIYLTDPYVLAAYIAALVGSVMYMFVLERYEVSVAFPLYIGITVLLVTVGGVVLFGEQLTTSRIVGIFLILAGVAIGARD